MYKVTYNANLTKLTTFGVPAECGCLVEYDDYADLLRLAADHPALLAGEVFCLGGGSNVLFRSERYRGTVLHCVGNRIEDVTAASECEGDGNSDYYPRLRAQAGVILDDLVDKVAGRGLWGLENLAAIPGSVGGAAVQNVGAYGAEFSQCVASVTAFDLDTLKRVKLTVEECDYGYRHSYFKTSQSERLVICEVELRLSARRAPRLDYAGVRDAIGDVAEDAVTPAIIAKAVREVRREKLPDPTVVGSAGSYFKNPVVPAASLPNVELAWLRFCAAHGVEPLPLQYHATGCGEVKLSAAWMIDKAGCKTFSVGGASLWPSQPLVIVNMNLTATAADIIALQRMVQDRVEAAFAVRLEPEVVQLDGF